MNLTVIIPIFNEKNTLKKVIKRVLSQGCVSEIIMVDDGSTDGSTEIAEKLIAKRIKLIKKKKNQGKGAAIITGIKKAKGDLLIIQDADLELDPSEYSKLIKPLLEKRAEFVVGNRWYKNNYFSLTRLGNMYLTLVFNILFKNRLHDPYSCYKVGSVKNWKKLKLESKRFEIEAEIMAKICLGNFKITEVPISYFPRKYQQGKKIRAFDALLGTKKLLDLRF